MTREELIAALKAATEPSRELDGDIALHLGLVPPDAMRMTALCPAKFATGPFTSWSARFYTGSLDAALTLVPADHSWVMGNLPDAMVWPSGLVGASFRSGGATPAIALCIAALKARA